MNPTPPPRIARRVLILCGLASGAITAAPANADGLLHGDPARGKTLYSACMGCHSLDDNDVGPRHRGVVGRHAGVVPGYSYSAALKASGLTWTEANLDRWLSGPQAMVPGAKMYFSIPDPQRRADIIAYLATQR